MHSNLLSPTFYCDRLQLNPCPLSNRVQSNTSSRFPFPKGDAVCQEGVQSCAQYTNLLVINPCGIRDREHLTGPTEADGLMLLHLTVTFVIAIRMACQLRTEK